MADGGQEEGVGAGEYCWGRRETGVSCLRGVVPSVELHGAPKEDLGRGARGELSDCTVQRLLGVASSNTLGFLVVRGNRLILDGRLERTLVETGVL